MNTFKPKSIYFEKNITEYELGKELLRKYEDVPKFEDLVNEFETKDKKINRYFSDLENNNKNLFDTYNFICRIGFSTINKIL